MEQWSRYPATVKLWAGSSGATIFKFLRTLTPSLINVLVFLLKYKYYNKKRRGQRNVNTDKLR